jgi:hypothetical protein
MANELFIAGEELTAAKANRLVGAGAWTSYVPTLTQLGAVPKTVEYASYNRRGDEVKFDFSLAVTGAGGTAGNPIRVGTPPLAQIAFRALGGFFAVFNSSAGVWWSSGPFWGGANVVQGQGNGYTGAFGQASGGMTEVLAAGDVVSGSIWYRTSS